MGDKDDILLDLLVVRYDNSLFTNAHDVVSKNEPVKENAFSHLGVKMDGLESARHFNFLVDDKDNNNNNNNNNNNTPIFSRNEKIQNKLEVKIIGPNERTSAKINKIEFNTAYYYNNYVKRVYKIKVIENEKNRKNKKSY